MTNLHTRDYILRQVNVESDRLTRFYKSDSGRRGLDSVILVYSIVLQNN